jgi:acyl-coenzyme A thioesterase 13
MSTDNPRVNYLRQFIGQKVTKSPSPVAIWLGGTTLEVSEGRYQASFVVRKEMTNPQGVIHGGIVSTILDDLMGASVYTLNRETAYTSINLNVDFLYGAYEGDVITGEGYVVRAGKNVIHLEASLYHPSGNLMAKAASNMVPVNRPQIKE